MVELWLQKNKRRVEIDTQKLRKKLIKMHIGADKRTIQKYVKMLTEDLEFLEPTAKNPLGIIIYKIDIQTTEQYVSEHLKEKLRQLTLLDVRLKQEEEVKAEKV
jgi:hypothetical protein